MAFTIWINEFNDFESVSDHHYNKGGMDLGLDDQGSHPGSSTPSMEYPLCTGLPSQ